MTHGPRTPEELEALLEDAFIRRDPGAIPPLFEPRALLAAGVSPEARGCHEIAQSAASLWERDYTYLADPRRVVQAHDLALVLAAAGTNVLRRGADGAWRYSISLLAIDQLTNKEDQ